MVGKAKLALALEWHQHFLVRPGAVSPNRLSRGKYDETRTKRPGFRRTLEQGNIRSTASVEKNDLDLGRRLVLSSRQTAARK